MLNVEYTVQFLLFGPSLHAAKHQLLSNLFTSLTLLHLDAHMRFGVNVSRGVLSGSHCYQSQVFVLVPLEKRGGVSQLTQQPKPNDLRWSQCLTAFSHCRHLPV